jgi:Type I phosphodiesterase / nucleotide pyrophosphatase
LKPVDTQDRDVVAKGDRLTGGHYLRRPTLAEILQDAGKTTVIAGAKPVAILQDRSERRHREAVGINLFAGETLPESAAAAIQAQLGKFPSAAGTGNAKPNEPRDDWTARALIGPLWSNAVPAFSMLWLSEPDYSQHASGPGSAKALAAVESSDQRLGEVLAELDRRRLRDKTDLFVVSDHGFSTVEKSVDVNGVLRRAGFPAYRAFQSAPAKDDILVVGQGGTVLFYLVGHDPAAARRLIDFLQQQDFAGTFFTREPLGDTFTLAQANINAANAPDVVLSMRWSTNASQVGAPGLFISDGSRKPGEGNHASLSRFDMHNTLVGAGPDLKRGFVDTLPTGNTDIAPTVLWLLGVQSKEPMDGRILSEALVIDAPKPGQPTSKRLVKVRQNGELHWRQYLQFSQVDQTIYLDEANGGPVGK